LPSDFLNNLPASFVTNNPGVNDTLAVQYFFPSNSTNGGLFVSPENVSLTFTYEGASAAFTNQSEASFSFANIASLFKTGHTGTPVGSTYTASFNVGPAPGLVPFAFNSLCFASNPCDRTAPNGGTYTGSPNLDNLSVAFATLTPNVAYAFLEDSYVTKGERDWNDMIVKIVGTSTFLGTPLPASAVLFAGGLSLLGFAGMRKRRRGASVASFGTTA